MSKTHWKKTIDKDWIGCYVLPPSGKPDNGKPDSNPYLPVVVTILKVDYKEVSVKGQDKLHKVAYFAKNPYFNKPMILSASKNLSRLSKFAKSAYVEDWGDLNFKVTLQAEWDMKYGGGKDWALRIAAKLPEKPSLPADKLAGAIKAVADGNTSIEKIKATYTLNKDQEEKLNGAIQNKG